ncbi:glucan-beta-d-glucosidase [Plasmopara halstedii]|uniref:glucan endo-1,3-beta-D-glucosidase n=1 Tax=Plasmopara halstedii TaxID=4781 RepID=A0A0P1AGZ5_PLAHL|nr:glucan-beta-d-glucosidase [Plasmopara halstedii]CEG40210.1 glucan-beta-d-glucosidase [Plasmopara halstedii]|eukprot:XP_024576579.1 glucan-beta-d-glucosidase [Plasmopara halstedii]
MPFLSSKEAMGQNFCIHGINYSPRIGPDCAPFKVTDSIRLFGLGDRAQSSTVVPVAINAGLSVSLGFWVSDEDSVFESEFSMLNTLLQQKKDFFTNGSIVDIHVGSEAIYREDVTAAQNIAYLQRVKSLFKTYSLNVPVTIAEIGDIYLTHPEIIDDVDFVQANEFPFGKKIAVEDAVAYFESRMEPLFNSEIARDKKMVIGETGWASNGSSLKQKELEFYYFEAFDEKWKADVSIDSVEGHFGLFCGNRTVKADVGIDSVEGHFELFCGDQTVKLKLLNLRLA